MSHFKNIIISFFLSEFGRAMYFVTVTWLLYQLTKDPLYTGILISLGFLPGLLLNLFFGVIVDRFNRKLLSVIASLVSVFSICLLLFFFAFNSIEPWIIIAVHMLLQVSGSLFRPAIQAFIAECFDKDSLPKIYSQSSSAAILGGLLGASMGGLVISIVSVVGSLFIVAGSLAIALISLLLIRNKEPKKRSIVKKNSFIKDMANGFVYVRNNKSLLGLFLIMFNGQLVFHTSLGFLSVYTVEFLLRSSTVYGLLDATISVGGVLAGATGAWFWKKGKDKIVLYSMLIVLVGLLLLGTSPVLPVSFIGVFLIGLGTTWIRVLLQSLQQMLTDSEFHGRMTSFRMIGNQGAVVISAPLLGWVATNFGANYIFLCLMLPISLSLIYNLIISNREKLMKIKIA